MKGIIPLAIAAGLLLTGANAPATDALEPTRLRKLLRDLADEAFEHLVIKDPHRRVYGMAYEFKSMPDGPLFQDFGLDSMHDGAWLMSALVTAHRADPDGRHLARVQQFSAPFYINVLRNSDRLFPNMIPRDGQERFTRPIKGWAPRGWDDGPGIDLVELFKGRATRFSSGVVSHTNGTVVERDADGTFLHAYFTSSHHLFQDLADSLLNVWLTTRDPAAAEAVRLIHDNRMKIGFRIPVVQTAAGLMTGDEALTKRRPPEFAPASAFRPLWPALVELAHVRVGHYNDGLAWQYRDEAARTALAEDGKIAPGFLHTAVAQILSQALTTRAFYGEHWKPGMTLGNGVAEFRDARLVRRGNDDSLCYARAMQYAWIAAAVLPQFRSDAAGWNAAVAGIPRNKRATLRKGCAELGVTFELEHPKVVAALEEFVDGTIDYWSRVRRDLGYLPRIIKPNRKPFSWARHMELGAYAHLINLTALRLMDLNRTDEVTLTRQQTPTYPLPHTPLPDSVLHEQGLK